jgi:hypothetical protein
LLTHETEERKEAAGEEEPDHDVGQAVHAQVETTAAHQRAPRAENQNGSHQRGNTTNIYHNAPTLKSRWRPSIFVRKGNTLMITRAHHVLKIKMAAISIC